MVVSNITVRRKETSMNNKCGFSKDENALQLSEIFQDNAKFKEIHIDIYSNNPFEKVVLPVLMLRHVEKNATVSNDGRSIIINANDRYNTYIAEIPLNTINKSYFKRFFKDSFEFILNCQNLFYKLTIYI